MTNIPRRSFLRLGAGVLAAAELPRAAWAKRAPLAPLELKPIEIAAGASKPFGAVHVSDTHIVRADRRDDARKITLAANRNFAPWGEHYLDEAIRAAESAGEMLIHTGDLIDFVSAANLDMAEGHFAGHDWFVSSGNHEFSQYVGEAKEDAAYKAASYARVQSAYPNDLTFASRVVNGVNFVAVDDVYYNVTARQHELFKAEVEKGLPIVMLCHVPLYGPKLYDFVMKATNNKCAYVTGRRAAARGRPHEGLHQVAEGAKTPQGDPLRTPPPLLRGAFLAHGGAVRLQRDFQGPRLPRALLVRRRNVSGLLRSRARARTP